jgi:CxxC motif-containing protein
MKCDLICCTTCPSECQIRVCQNDHEIIKIEGNKCKRGIKFAEKEMIDPVRTLTSTVIYKRGVMEIPVPVKTSGPIALRNMKAAMQQIKASRLDQPCKLGDVIITDICGSGVDLLACKTVKG